jgi:hypothetical protein
VGESSDVGDRELIEAEHPGLFRKRPGHRRDRIVFLRRAFLARQPVLLDAVMHVGHEGVEMHAPLAPHRDCLDEHVHQHGLAAADATMDVEPPHEFGRRPVLGEQPAKRTRLALQALRPDLIDQPVERSNDLPLRRIVGGLACGDEMRITLRDGRMRLEAVSQVHRSLDGKGWSSLPGKRDRQSG